MNWIAETDGCAFLSLMACLLVTAGCKRIRDGRDNGEPKPAAEGPLTPIDPATAGSDGTERYTSQARRRSGCRSTWRRTRCAR